MIDFHCETPGQLFFDLDDIGHGIDMCFCEVSNLYNTIQYNVTFGKFSVFEHRFLSILMFTIIHIRGTAHIEKYDNHRRRNAVTVRWTPLNIFNIYDRTGCFISTLMISKMHTFATNKDKKFEYRNRCLIPRTF